ncbi:MAG: phosphatidylglycerophosphatase A [Pseudomonadota bacterium]
MSRLIATVFYAGYLRPASGTWGSLAALLLAIPVVMLGGVWALAIGAGVAYAAGHWATAQMVGPGHSDPSEVVIDELVGQWIALLPVAWMYGAVGAAPVIWWASAAAFGLFRLFDIAKPGPVGAADRRGDVTGVMLDDVIAGVFAAVIVGAGLIALAVAATAAWTG